jgi:hypothetical protein
MTGHMMTGLTYSLKFDKTTYRVGEKIQVVEELVNTSKTDINIDGGSLSVHYLVLDADGNNIDEWPYTDVHCPPPGPEALWKLLAGETFRSTYSLLIDDKEWVGFGVPGSKYKGVAIEVTRTAGDSIYRLAKVPGTYTIIKKFYTFGWAKDRAKELGFKDVFEGELMSPPLKIIVNRT